MAKRTITSGADNNELLVQFGELVKTFKAQQNAVPMGKELFSAFSLLESLIKDLDAQVGKLPDLDALVKQVNDLAAIIAGLDLENLDPEKIKQRVLDALAGWRAELDAKVKSLAEVLPKHAARLDALEADVKKLKDTQIDPAALVQRVLELLAEWRTGIENAIKDIQKQLVDTSKRLDGLAGDLLALKQRFDAVDFENLKPEKLIQQVLDRLAVWQQQIKTVQDALVRRLRDLEAWKVLAENHLKKIDSRLGGHDADIAKLRTDLDLLDKEVQKIISTGGPDPEDIKRRVLAALELWQKKIEADLLAFDTRLDKDEEDIKRHEAAILDLTKKVNKLLETPGADPEAIKQMVLAALAEWRNAVDDKLGAHNATLRQHGADIDKLRRELDGVLSKIPGLEKIKPELTALIQTLRQQLEERIGALEKNLLAQVKRLDERINAINTTGVDPEEVRRIIRAEFAAWQLETDKELQRLSKALADLKAEVETLKKRLENIPTEFLDAEKVKNIIEAELGAWRKKVDNQISALGERLKQHEQAHIRFDRRLDSVEAAIIQLPKDIAALKAWVEEQLKNGVDPEAIKDQVLAALAEWRKKTDDQLHDHALAIRKLQALAGQLLDRLNELEKNAPDAAEIQKKVLALLALWQHKLEEVLETLTGKVSKSEGDIGKLRTDLTALEDRLNDLILTGGTPEDVEKRIREALLNWKKQLERELDAIRERNEEDARNFLRLDKLVGDLRDRVKDLEDRDIVKAVLREVLKTLELRFATIETKIKGIDEITQKLNELTQQGGIIDGLQKHLILLANQVKTLPKESDVKRLIAEALHDLLEWKTTVDSKIQDLYAKHGAQETALGNLATQITEGDEALADTIDQKIAATEGKITELDQRTDGRLDDAEGRLTTNESLDQTQNGRLDTAEHRLDQDDIRHQEIQGQLADLQRQIDEWQPDPGGDVADRLARRCLQGRGILCGFDVWYTRKFTLHIGPGAGVSSDGHLLLSKEAEHYTHFRRFEQAAAYDFFVKNEDADGNRDTWPVWELVAEKADETGCTPLTPQRTSELSSPFLQDKVVFVLLPPEGRPEPSELRFVLMRRADAMLALRAGRRLQRRLAAHEDTDYIFEEPFSPMDEIPFEEDIYHALRPELGLREIPLPRFGFRIAEDCTVEELDQTEFPHPLSIGELYKTYTAIIEDVFADVEKQMKKVIRLYHRLLFPQFPAQYFTDALARLDEKWTDYKVFCEKYKDKPEEARHYVQYFYDWARDLLAAYHELRAELLQLMAACCIRDEDDPQAQHPRHLMLGIAMREEYNGLAAPLRHEFYQPPIYNGNAARLETCRLYLRRWFLLVDTFLLPLHDDPETNPVCHCDEDGNYPALPDYDILKITPGRGYFHPLSRQSIPYYYLVTQGTQSVHRFWEYRRTKTHTENQHLCYHADDSDESYSSLPHVIRPLHFSFDAYDFYRIEGHIGKTSPIIEDYKKLRQKYNLDFDVLEVDVSTLTKTYDDPVDHYNSFIEKYLGAEHLAGVPKGGTFILVTGMVTGVSKIIADFSLPYRVNWELADLVLDSQRLEDLERSVRTIIDRLESMQNAFIEIVQAEAQNSMEKLEAQIAQWKTEIFTKIQNDLEVIQTRLATLQTRIDTIETSQASIRSELTTLNQSLGQVLILHQETTTLLNDFKTILDSIENRVKILESKIHE